MSDALPPSAGPAESGRIPGTRRRFALRWTRRGFLVAVGLLAASLVTLFTIDLGPVLRKQAEAGATKYLERPMHIGKLVAKLTPGEFELRDVRIEGERPSDTPFFTAKKITVRVPWTTLFRKELVVEVLLSDWEMTIETTRAGTRLPKLTRKSSGKKGPIKTTVRYVYGRNGKFTYLDHVTPWSVVAPNLAFDFVRASNLNSYVGTASFDRGTVQIQKYLPMQAKLSTRFTLEAPLVHMHHIDLVTDGARSSLTGVVDFNRFPEQTYDIKSRLDLSRMREIFFANDSWRVDGDASFNGRFHLFKGGYELGGRFGSALAALIAGGKQFEFPDLQGSVEWVPKKFSVTNATAAFYGGRAAFDYVLAPLGSREPATARFDVGYDSVDLPAFFRAINWRGLDLHGRAAGQNSMTWTNSQFSATRHGEGQIAVTPPAGVTLASAALPSSLTAEPEKDFQKDRALGPLPAGGEVHYRFEPSGFDFDRSWVASPTSYVAFSGRANVEGSSNLPFHVTSLDWQASDRLLAAILTAAGSPTGVVQVGGYGQFDGAMTGPFSRPIVAGHFAGAQTWTWGVKWGRAVGDIVIENSYVTVKNGRIGDQPDSTIVADGKYSLGYPRRDTGEELNSHVLVRNWPLDDFRTAFGLTDWPMDGVVGDADITLTGKYTAPFGKGTLRIDRGIAWGETFDTAVGNLTFNGVGLEITPITMTKGPGRLRGSASIYWDKTYSFDADGEKVPVESLTSFTLPKSPLSGVLDFKAHGAGSFDRPEYEFRAHVPDLSISSQGVGDVTGVLQVRNNTLFITQLEAASGLLQASGSGSIALNKTYDSNLTFRFTDTSIDPYLPFIAPGLAPKISRYTRARVSGSLQIQGELSNPSAINASASVDDARLTLLTYQIRNQEPLRMTLANNVIRISHLVLVGEGTRLSLEGDIPITEAPIKLTASGDANLEILQGFFPNLVSSGAAVLNASVSGSGGEPRFSGQAQITDGRVRYRTFPHGLDHINGPITFDATAINVEGLHGQLSSYGDVQFHGNIRLNGYSPEMFDLRATGTGLRLHVPPGFGFVSTVNANLTLVGPMATPTLGGAVTVLRSTYLPEIDSDLALLRLALGTAAGGGEAGGVTEFVPTESAFQPKLDVQISAPGTLAIVTNDARVYGSANLDLRGSWDNPAITGLVSIDRGEILFSGNRYTVRPSQIRFSNPARVDPFFDVEVATRARRGAQTYDITGRVSGTMGNLTASISSDPFLPTYDVMLLMFGELPDVQRAELHSATPQASQQQLMRTAAAQILTMPISSTIGSVVQKSMAIDTFSIVPLLGEGDVDQRAGARITLSKRISDRTYLTYSRALNQQGLNEYDVFLLEYEQSDRLSWMLSRTNERQQATFAIDFRVRHVF